MKRAVYRFAEAVSRRWGAWFFSALARIIATGYFLFSPARVRISVHFYQALFPEKSFLYHLWCSWRQFHRFTRIFTDRFQFLDSGRKDYISSGWHHLDEAIRRKEGGIILMSHLGNWEVAAHLLKKRSNQLKLLLYLGAKHKEQIEKMQKESLARSGTKIIAVDQEGGGSPFLLIEAIKWMNEGGLVSMTGDIVWTKEQKTITVDVLNRKADLPESPFMLALLSGKPIFVMFSVPDNTDRLSITVSEPIYVVAKNRRERRQAVQETAQQYADMLMETVRRHPFEWFHFDRFLK